MNILTIVITVFVLLELLNIIILYFSPGSKIGNGVGVFNAYEKSKDYPEIHSFIKYLINWVAGTKLIFVTLLIVILITGGRTTRIFSAAALVFSIATFYWRLYPAIRKMDEQEVISPKGYSKTLLVMITVFLAGFLSALAISLL